MHLYKHLKKFNDLQKSLYDTLTSTDVSLVIAAPTGSGKTTLFEMAIQRLLMKYQDNDFCAIYCKFLNVYVIILNVFIN